MSIRALSISQQEIISKPFIFISYCWDDPKIRKMVAELAETLRTNGVPVLYDECGKETSDNSKQLTHQIAHPNCKKVLIVSDTNYSRKILSDNGVDEQLNYIISNHHNNPQKYVLLNAGDIITLFRGKTIFNFDDETSFNEIVDYCLKTLGLNQKGSRKSRQEPSMIIHSQYVSANSLFDNEAYSAALRKIDDAINMCVSLEKSDILLLLKLYHLKLITLINLEDADGAIELSEIMELLIPENCDTLTKVRCFGNFALAYRLKDSKSNEFEEYARTAYEHSKDLDDDWEKLYYARLYGEALFYTEQYCNAYEIEEEAIKLLCELNPYVMESSDKQFVEFIALKSNHAETTMHYSREKRGKTKQKLLLESERIVLEVSNSVPLVPDEQFKYQAYKIFAEIYSELRDYYMNK